MWRRNPKSFLYWLHRWSGVAVAIVMLLWFLSGIVMLFVGYPKLYPWEHMARLEPLRQASCCVPLQTALAAVPSADGAIGSINVVTVGQQPHYHITKGGQRYVVDAQTGVLLPEATAQQAVDTVKRYLPGSSPTYEGLVESDLWTRSGALHSHRPLHKVLAHDAADTLVYVSSKTGEVVQLADAQSRAWNYVGAWLHWLYMFRGPTPDPIWHWLVVVLSAIAVVSTIAGTVVGIWRWRFRKPYASGARTPYPSRAMRWHHIAGLLFCGVTLTWIVSGLLSMNPFNVFSPAQTPNRDAYQAKPLQAQWFDRSAQDLLAAMPPDSLREIQWVIVGGSSYLLGRTADNQTVVMPAEGEASTIVQQLDQTQLVNAAKHLFNAPIASVQRLEQYDSYYYARAPQAMRGAREKPLPVLRIEFADPVSNWVHIDPRTGVIESSMDKHQRVGRWWFELLHSWDLPMMLKAEVLRNSVLVVLSVGGVLMSATGVLIGYRRVRSTVITRRQKRARRALLSAKN
ncbi:PepSY domain-containing protein [Paenalcaligenes suwonensis]|uniref:PepSY domain-containing protein n=1 Tax=Paenalcaligenes suwonensis TaxID=1202713 RepID=UPI00140D72DB|nr:PepSY domain-containing protein [Paenalcaligenes suwonensis]NHC63138.1 PepSY domain-containing protein [Paenalcaligenes suwonensis]